MSLISMDGTSNLSGSGEFSAHPYENGSAPGISVGSTNCPKCGMALPRSVRSCPNDGTDLLLRQGQIFAEKYELIEQIGSGGMGVIFKAKHLILDKFVAIKVLHNTNTDPNLIIRFQREAKAASSLSHINVITVYDFGVHEGVAPYMVMDYLQGRTLAEYLEEKGQLPLRESLDIVEQVLTALAHAHKKNILHRDLKPSNLMMLAEEGEPLVVKILDFGLAKLISGEEQVALSAVGAAMGSPAYMSPEQATGLKVDTRSDLYSLGCIMFELLTGKPPLLGDSPMETLMARLNQRVPAVREFLKSSQRSRDYDPHREIPTIVELFVAKLLERDQRDRFQSAQEARNYLSTIWQYLDVDAPPERARPTVIPAAKPTAAPRVTVQDLHVANPVPPANANHDDQTINSKAEMSQTGSRKAQHVRHARKTIDYAKDKVQKDDSVTQVNANVAQVERIAAAEPKADSAPGTTAQDNSRQLRCSHQNLRRITKEEPILTPPLSGSSGNNFEFDPRLWLRVAEQNASKVKEMARLFRHANPWLYWLALAIAFTALLVIINILK